MSNTQSQTATPEEWAEHQEQKEHDDLAIAIAEAKRRGRLLMRDANTGKLIGSASLFASTMVHKLNELCDGPRSRRKRLLVEAIDVTEEWITAIQPYTSDNECLATQFRSAERFVREAQRHLQTPSPRAFQCAMDHACNVVALQSHARLQDLARLNGQETAFDAAFGSFAGTLYTAGDKAKAIDDLARAAGYDDFAAACNAYNQKFEDDRRESAR